MAQASLLLALPPDVLQRTLASIPLADHNATASACRTFRAVITKLPAVRRGLGLRERGIVVVKIDSAWQGDRLSTLVQGHWKPLEICLASNSSVVATIDDGSNSVGVGGIISGKHIYPEASTTDGTRLFFTAQNWQDANFDIANGPRIDPREDIFVVEASSSNPYAPIQWSRFATLPPNQFLGSIEWHNGCLYAFGACDAYSDPTNPGHLFFDCFRVFREATGLWEDLPHMPHACIGAASGVIGDCLYVAGGYRGDDGHLSTLQIYDFASRTWRFGAPVPEAGGDGVVFDGKLFCIGLFAISFYDPQSDTWTVDETELPWQDMVRGASFQFTIGETDHTFYRVHIVQAVPHQGRLVVFLDNCTAFARAADGSWSRYEVAEGTLVRRNYAQFVAASVLLG